MNVSCEANLVLQEYVAMLIKWNKSINLIGQSTLPFLWERHILDCLQLLTYIDANDLVLDLGSGAGLPGIVLSIMGIKDVVLIEADERKCAFLRQVSKLSTNNITVLNDRVESLDNLECDVFVARAFGSLDKILLLELNVKKKFLLLKGQNVHQEIKDAQKKWLFD
jgi:16S rRNA (guanine527-N7)-methyltransferase